jgi:hypothetical protein
VKRNSTFESGQKMAFTVKKSRADLRPHAPGHDSDGFLPWESGEREQQFKSDIEHREAISPCDE